MARRLLTQGEKTKALLKSLHQDAVDLSHRMQFDGGHALHIHCICLYGSILEYVTTILLLTKDGPKTGVPIILRSMLEAVVDLKNLSLKPSYGFSLELKSLTEGRKFLNTIIAGNNANTAGLDIKAAKQSLSDVNRRIENAELKGGKPLTQKEKFKRAGMSHEYVTTYSYLCGHSHNTKSILTSRHIARDAAGNVEFVYYRDTSLDDIEGLLGAACSLLVMATLTVHRLLQSGQLPGVAKMEEKIGLMIASHPATVT